MPKLSHKEGYFSIEQSSHKEGYCSIDQSHSEEVNPYPKENAESKKKSSSTFQTTCNLLSDIEGTGLLALPYVIQNGGLVAIISLVAVPIICYYTGKILIESLYAKDSQGQKIRVRSNYKDSADACCPKYGGSISSIFQLLELVFLGSLYLVLCGSLMCGLVPGVRVTARQWVLLAGCIVLPSLFIKYLSDVAWFSLVSIIALTLAAALILVYGLAVHPYSLDSIKSIPIWDPKGTPIALSIIVFSYSAHPGMPTIEENMKNPEKFNFVLALTIFSTCLLKIVFGMVGFVAFYPNINDVIANSISFRPIQISVNCLLAINALFSYPYLVKTVIHSIEDSIDCETLREKFQDKSWFFFIRIFVFLIILLPAITIPHFVLIMSFASSLLSMFTLFILPCSFHLVLAEDLRWYHKCIDVIIIIFGIAFGVVGLIVSSADIAKTF